MGMAYNPKKQYNKLLRALKSKMRSGKDKKLYLERQAKKMDANPTGCESSFIEMMNELKVTFESQKIIQGKIFDFYIPDKNLIFEIDGNYWHGYGKTYEEMNDIQKRTYKNDRKKDVLAKGLGYGLIRIWEHELNDELYSETKERLRGLLK